MAFPQIEESLSRCGDRITLGLNNIETLWYIHVGSQAQSLPQLAALAVGLKRLELINAKARSTPAVDPVEVELFLQVRLAEALKLPVDTKSMLYPSCSAIKEDALPAIIRDIKAKTTSSKDVVEALLEQDFWKEKLRSDGEYRFDFNEIVEAVIDSSEGADVDVQKAHINQALGETYREATEDWYNAHKDELAALI